MFLFLNIFRATFTPRPLLFSFNMNQFDIDSPDYEVKVMNWIRNLPDYRYPEDSVLCNHLIFNMRSNGINFSGLKLMLFPGKVTIFFKGMSKVYRYTEMKELDDHKSHYHLKAFIIDDLFWFYKEYSSNIFGEFEFQEFGMDMTMPFLDKFNQ